MSDLTFHEEEYAKPSSIQTKARADSFGLSTFLIKHGIAPDVRSAKRLSRFIMLAIIILSFILIVVLNTGGGESAIDDKYRYDPTAPANDP
jgi:hypothetical protein